MSCSTALWWVFSESEPSMALPSWGSLDEAGTGHFPSLHRLGGRGNWLHDVGFQCWVIPCWLGGGKIVFREGKPFLSRKEALSIYQMLVFPSSFYQKGFSWNLHSESLSGFLSGPGSSSSFISQAPLAQFPTISQWLCQLSNEFWLRPWCLLPGALMLGPPVCSAPEWRLSCDLNSPKDFKRVDFQCVRPFSCSEDGNDNLQAL